MKAFTDLEQSKKLADILPIESADMVWTYDFTVNDINGINVISNNFKIEENDIPAWSLSALLDVLPVLKRIGYEKAKPNIHFNVFTNKWVCNSLYYTSDSYDNPIDAAFEMICWLKENFEIYEQE